MIELIQYRDLWLKEKMNEVIGFYPREFYPLDNFSSFKVEYKGYLYSSAEEAYQAAHFFNTAPEIVEEIKNSHSAHEAQKICYANKDKQDQDWSTKALAVMKEILICKIEQNPYVLKKILETKDYLIVEDSPKDSYWGWGSDRLGENNLGKLWMELREEYNHINKKYKDKRRYYYGDKRNKIK